MRLPRAAAPVAGVYPADEQPCFPIRHIVLNGDSATQFAWALKAADGANGLWLGSAGINTVLARVQDALVAAGYVTTRVLAVICFGKTRQKIDAAAMLEEVEANREITQATFQQAVRFTDEAYRKMFVESAEMYLIVTGEHGKPILNMDALPEMRMLTSEERLRLEPGSRLDYF